MPQPPHASAVSGKERSRRVLAAAVVTLGASPGSFIFSGMTHRLPVPGGRISRENDHMSQPRILIVHPDPSSLALLSSMLRSLGHVIDEAANDRVAVRLMERGGIAMVLAGVEPADADAL